MVSLQIRERNCLCCGKNFVIGPTVSLNQTLAVPKQLLIRRGLFNIGDSQAEAVKNLRKFPLADRDARKVIDQAGNQFLLRSAGTVSANHRAVSTAQPMTNVHT